MSKDRHAVSAELRESPFFEELFFDYYNLTETNVYLFVAPSGECIWDDKIVLDNGELKYNRVFFENLLESLPQKFQERLLFHINLFR